MVQVQKTLFRLTGSRLKVMSPYFADLLTHDDEVRESMAGCAVYVLKNVTVLDFARLLDAFDNAMYVFPDLFHLNLD